MIKSQKSQPITRALQKYMIKFVIRLMIFICVFVLYFTKKEWMIGFMTHPLMKEITPLHGLWFVFMIMMIRHIIPTETLSMAFLKSEKKRYDEVDNYSQQELLEFIKAQNARAWVVMLIWLSFNAVFGVFYLKGIMDEADLLMLTVFYFLSDYICILFFCPFQSFIMKNRCCVNCRIYDWGHFMMFTPMLFIRNFYSWSLFFTACVVLIKWEIIFANHPERFFYGSNKNLQCANCKDKICQYKKVV